MSWRLIFNMQLSKTLINHLQNTDDKIIVVDKNGKPEVVVLSFSAYQRLLELLGQLQRVKGGKSEIPSSECCKLRSDLAQESHNNRVGLTSDEYLDKINSIIAQSKEKDNLENLQKSEEVFFTIDKEKRAEHTQKNYIQTGGEVGAEEVVYLETVDFPET
jgi:hypothetical protein